MVRARSSVQSRSTAPLLTLILFCSTIESNHNPKLKIMAVVNRGSRNVDGWEHYLTSQETGQKVKEKLKGRRRGDQLDDEEGEDLPNNHDELDYSEEE